MLCPVSSLGKRLDETPPPEDKTKEATIDLWACQKVKRGSSGKTFRE